MNHIWKILFLISVVVNLLAIWGFFHYIRYGGSPLGELKRMLTGATKQTASYRSYVEQNAQIMAEMEAGNIPPNRVVFFGASITARWDLDNSFPGFHMINRGVGGQLAPAMLSRFKRDVIDLKPDAVIVKFCSINIRPEMPLSTLQDAMVMMIQLARVNGIKLIISTIIPAGKPEAHIGDFNVAGTLNKFNDWVRQYASKERLPIIDFARAIEDESGFLPRDCSTDPVHVNGKGYAILTGAARPVIESVLGLH